MKAIRSYIGVYSRLYKLIVLMITPLLFIGLITSALPGTYQPLYIYAWSTIVMSYIELYGEFYSIGGIYKRNAPFGLMTVSSSDYRRFVTRFAVTDAVRRLVYYILTDMLPLPFIALLYDGQGISAGMRPSLAFLVAVIGYALSQLAVWAYRLTDTPLVTVFILIMMTALDVLPIIWLMASPTAEMTLYPIAITTAIAASGLSIRTLIHKTESDIKNNVQ